MTAKSLFNRFVGAAALVGVAACGDAPTAPITQLHPKAPTGLDFSLIGTLVKAPAGDTTVTVFTVDPRTSTTFPVGSAHVVYFPAFSICDMSTTTYGPTEWDRPCKLTGRPVTITAKSWIDANGEPQVDFSPAMRFHAATGESVQLGVAVDSAMIASSPSVKILYCANALMPCIDESIADPSLATWVNASTNTVYRRIKHFSGYNISSGRAVSELSLLRVGNGEEATVSRTGHLMSSGRQ